MLHFMSRSLLVQLLSVYLLFVIVVLLGGVGVNAVVEQQLRNNVQASDQALAQEIATQTSLQLCDDENALVALSNIAVPAGIPTAPATMASIFQAWKAARSDVDYISWVDPIGDVRVSWPLGKAYVDQNFRRPTSSSGPSKNGPVALRARSSRWAWQMNRPPAQASSWLNRCMLLPAVRCPIVIDLIHLQIFRLKQRVLPAIHWSASSRPASRSRNSVSLCRGSSRRSSNRAGNS